VNREFDHEKLHVYRASLEFVRFVSDLNTLIPSRHRNARDQLTRSSQSIPLNIAEGNGKRHLAERKRYFEIARGSAMESAATLDVLVTVAAVDASQTVTGKELLFRIVSMLSKMTDQRESAVREDGVAYVDTTSDDYEDEHEHEKDGAREGGAGETVTVS